MGEDVSELVRPLIDVPAEAVADAMMVTQAEMVLGGDSTEQTEEFVRAATRGMCEAASSYSLYFLAKKYPHLFDAMGLLTTYDNSPSSKGRLKDRLSEYHTYFIVRDKKGMWYAASPANHTPNQESSALTRVIKSVDPQEVVRRIEEADGGEWPSGDFISQAFESEEYKHPSVGKSKQDRRVVLDTFRISNLYGQNRAFMDEADLIGSYHTILDSRLTI